jgi:hypothetical protein
MVPLKPKTDAAQMPWVPRNDSAQTTPDPLNIPSSPLNQTKLAQMPSVQADDPQPTSARSDDSHLGLRGVQTDDEVHVKLR